MFYGNLFQWLGNAVRWAKRMTDHSQPHDYLDQLMSLVILRRD